MCPVEDSLILWVHGVGGTTWTRIPQQSCTDWPSSKDGHETVSAHHFLIEDR